MRSICPLQIKGVELIGVINDKTIWTNYGQVYTLSWLKQHSLFKEYCTDYAEYYKRYCYV